MKQMVELIMADQKFVITGLFLKACKSLDVTLNEMFLLLYFENYPESSFEPKKLGKILYMSEEEIVDAFSSLNSKGIIGIETSTDVDGRVMESVNINGLNAIIKDFIELEKESNTKKDIYHLFETEFARPISPMEYEIVEAWLSNGTSEELIVGALKEAVYNGAKSFRYIDKIIYDWTNKGFKTMKDVKTFMTNRDKTNKTTELFEYNWLEDEENDCNRKY